MSLISNLALASVLALSAQAAPASLVPRAVACPAANGTTYSTGSSSYTIECGLDRFMGDMPQPNGQLVGTLDDCIGQCQARKGCVMVNYVPKTKACYVKSSVGYVKPAAWVHGAILSADAANKESPAVSAAAAPAPSSSGLIQKAAVAVPVPSVASAATSASSLSALSAGSTTLKSGKRGLSYNDPAFTSLFSSKVSWAYNWAATPGASISKGVTYIPMLWSNSADRVAAWPSVASAAIAAGADALLGFNEPDHAEQANMAVPAAVTAWQKSMQPFAGKAKLGSPAVTNGGSPMGLTWLKSFMSSCSSCTIDFCAIHWYDSATNVQYFKNYMADAHAACNGKPIWITEFGASGSDAQVEAFLRDVVPWMESQDYVQRYAYFMASKGVLVNAAGSALSTVGNVYNSM